ncbi:MAG: hypothetical protein AB1626_02700 [Candidatus Micrarchaeota archaeon]
MTKRAKHEKTEAVKKEKADNNWLYAVAAVAVVALAGVLFILFSQPAPAPLPSNNFSNASGGVKLELFVRPGEAGAMAAEKALKSVVGNFGNAVFFQPYFIVSFNGVDFDAPGGEAEVERARHEACVFKNHPASFLAYVDCVNDGSSRENCARLSGVDLQAARSCEEGGDGRQLLEQSSRVCQYLRVLAFNSPTLYVNTTLFREPITVTSVSKAVCAVNSSAAACRNVPACSADFECPHATLVGRCVDAALPGARCEFLQPSAVNLTVFTSSECGPCNASEAVAGLRRLFKGLSVTEADYATEEGKERTRYFGLQELPAFVFDQSVEDGESFDALEPSLTPVGSFYVMGVSGGFRQLVSRQRENNSLVFFAMSKCPYTAVAEAVLAGVAEAIPGAAIRVRFVAALDENGSIIAPGGVEELAEDKRQACVQKLFPEHFFNYALCRNRDLNASWRDCASGFNASRVAECAEGSEAEEMLRQDAEFASQAGASGSPVYLVNNQIRFSGVLSQATLAKYVCQANAGLAGCNASLPAAPQDAPSHGCAMSIARSG